MSSYSNLVEAGVVAVHRDHKTLWRFYQAHRQAMRSLLKHTVRTAEEVGLVDLAVQAVDGTKVAANAAGDRTYDAAALERLVAGTEATIRDLKAQNEGGDDPPPPRLPEELRQAQSIQHWVHYLSQMSSGHRSRNNRPSFMLTGKGA